MIKFEEALRKILGNTKRSGIEDVPIGEAVGCILAENVRADFDMPPFDKSAMDGYALRSGDPAGELKCIGIVKPGATFKKVIKNRYFRGITK